MKKKSATLLIRMPPDLKKALSKAAEEDSRSMASLIEYLIKKHLKEKGISWEE